MATRAIKRKRDDEHLGQPEWKPPEERAPSIVRAEQTTPGRVIAVLALFIAAVGGLAVLMAAIGRGYIIGPGLGTFLLALGVAGLLYHASSEKEQVYRRLYGALAALLGAAGVLLSFAPVYGTYGGLFLPVGAPCFALGLFFAVSFLRNEIDPFLRTFTLRVIGIAGAVMILVGVIGGIISEDFLMSRGIVYLMLAVLYVVSFVGMQSASSPLSYWAGFALGVVGALMIVVALGKSLPFQSIPGIGDYLAWINGTFRWVGWQSGQPGAPFLFTYIGLEFLALSIGICSDSPLVVLTRRELAAFFYSPVAYIVLVVLTILGGWSFLLFVDELLRMTQPANPFQPPPPGAMEPILLTFILNWIPIVSVIIMVPIITMRLLSEEQRSGTLEVLLTAPVRESTVVLSKFLAALRFFLLAWYPWALYLIALRVEGGEPFDYRPLLSFAIVLAVTGAGFIGMGLFFSSLSRNQIVAAVLTFMGMIVLFAIYFLKGFLGPTSTVWNEILTYISFIDLWIKAGFGQFAPRFLLFHISFAVFCLFLTVKVLESRKWR
jgi:ABC-type transport system involved in multi-copper enzyme maturation permease subunit